MEIGKMSTVNQTAFLLKVTYGLVPIVAGIDKFSNILTSWESYIPDSLVEDLPLSARSLMIIVGIVEIIAGLVVLLKPVIGGYIVSAWLMLIGLILIVGGNYFDVAVRDFVMAIGAFALAKLAKVVQ